MASAIAERPSVLLVEDDPLQRKALARWLQYQGCEPITARNEREAVDLARRRGPFDIAVVDLRLRVSTGDSLVRQLLGLGAVPSGRIAILTGYPEDLAGSDLHALGVSVLSKARSPQVLRQFLDAS